MTTFRPRLWTSVGAAVLISAGGLAACSGEDNATGRPAADTPPPATAASGGEGEGGEGEGGATGEAGAADAYAAAPAASRDALRLGHLKGFYLVAREARKTEGAEAAAALVGQGLLEVYDPAAAEFTRLGVDQATLRRAAQSGSSTDIQAGIAALDRAASAAGGDERDVAAGLVSISTGLYRGVVTADAVDPVEYQHSYGAALAARDVLSRSDAGAANADLDRFIALWPSVTAPEAPAAAPSAAAVQTQASRVELALSGA